MNLLTSVFYKYILDLSIEKQRANERQNAKNKIAIRHWVENETLMQAAGNTLFAGLGSSFKIASYISYSTYRRGDVW